jgi:hypothetical protein
MDTSSDAYFSMNYGGADITSLQKVSHNTIDMGAGTVFTNDTRGSGITFTSSFTGVVGGYTNIEITDNTIVNLKPFRRGIVFWNNAPAGTASGAVGDINAPVVSGNTVTGAPGYTGQFGIRLLGLVTNATVTNNDCDGVEYGFRGQAYNGLPVGAVVNGNSFTNVTYYSDWSGTGTLDASANWWGSNVAATVATKVSGAIDYTPWLDNGDDTSGDPGFQGDYSALRVGAASPQVGPKGRVQEGVDLVTGSTVYLAPGIYEEQVEIAKTLTLDGGGGGAIIKSPNVLTKFFGTNKPIVYIHDAEGVVVKGLTVDGAGRGNLNARFQGIAFWNAGGTVDHCVVKDIKDSPFSGAQHGVGIYSYSTGTASHVVNVWDCEVYGFQKNAMALNAGDTNPFTADVRRNIVTGAGATGVTAQNGIQVWAAMGGGTVADNAISGIGYSGAGWVATSLLQFYGDVDFIGNTVTNGHMGIYNNYGAGDITGNNITVSKIGDYCDGIIASDPVNKVASPFDPDAQTGAPGTRVVMGGALLDVNITGNTVTFSGPTNAGSYGIEAYAGWSPEDLDVAINGNDVSGFDYGVTIYKCTSGCDPDPGVFTSLVAQYNSLTGNTGYGMYSNVNELTTDARYNWWGAASGPFHTTLNPSGSGNQVSDYILFEPYFGAPNEVSVVPQYTLTNCTTPKTVTVHLDQVGIPTDEVRGYEIKFSVDPLVATAGAFVQGTFLSSAGSTQFYAQNNGSGVYTVSCAILGGAVGGKNGGDLFSMTLTPVGQGLKDIAFTSIKIRDLNNVQLAGAGFAGSIRVDCSYPTMEDILPAQNGWYNTAPVLSNFGFDDDVNLDLAEYKIDGGSWTTIFSAIDAATWNGDGWVVPGFDGLSQGSHTVYFRVKDDAGNWNGEGSPQPNLYSWQFNKDTIVPPPPTNFVALPGHDKVHLTWTNPADPNLAGIEIRRVAWGVYPHYAAAAPDYPADPGAGDLVVYSLAPAQAYDDNPRTPRAIYYYAAFSKDLAGNYSELGEYATDRATSYWLGDVTADGVVNINDLVPFSATFGLSEGHINFNALCDFGPTDDASRFGIPYPDNTIDFEDLMIFSMNWGKVLPVGLEALMLAGGTIENLEDLVKFDIAAGSENVISVVLKNQATTLKGIHIVMEIEGGELVRVNRGALLANRSDVFFGTLPGGNGTADVCVAALGVDAALLKASGEIARLEIKKSGEEPVVVRFKAIDLRNLDNNKKEIIVADEHEAPFVPTATALMQNFPNPFNPSTTLTFDVAQAGNVSIQVYDVSGRLLATLLNSYKEIGRHRVEWNGKNANGSLVPSGIYFYRMRAAGFEVTKKMILVR